MEMTVAESHSARPGAAVRGLAVRTRVVWSQLRVPPRAAMERVASRVVAKRLISEFRRQWEALQRAELERNFLATEKGSLYRAHPRFETSCVGQLCFAKQKVACEVMNISAGGAGVCLAEAVELPSQVRLKIEGVGEFAGRVAWRDETRLGIQFRDELHDVLQVVARMNAPAGAAAAD